jgi:Ni,Fe-hydrogenase maturation factor
VEQLERSAKPGVTFRTAFQLLPEHAELMAGVDHCIIVDASIEASDVLIEELAPAETQGPGLHGFSAQNIFRMALELFNANTRVFLCHVPACDLSHGTELSTPTSEAAKKAIGMLRDFIHCA